MEKEIRIYFESIEQGAHFVLPLIEKILKQMKLNIPIKLVKLKKNYSYYGRKLAPIIYWKDPDLLISLVEGDIEYPLMFIEFSSAVFTEDHELQRVDGLAVATKNKTCYIKISSTKKRSPSDHGGKIRLDYMKPYKLFLDKTSIVSFHIEWPLLKNSDNILDVNKNYLSSPPTITENELSELIENVLSFIFSNGIEEEWMIKFSKYLLKNKNKLNKNSYLKSWLDKLENTKVTISISTSSRVAYDSSSVLVLKFNRFGHAMDPERGMLSFYGTLVSRVVSKMTFILNNDAWYKDIPKENEIDEYIKKHGLKRGFDFLYCFMLGSGLFRNDDFKSIVSEYEKSSSECLKIDLTDFINNNFLRLNKALRTIFTFSKAFYIEDADRKKRVVFSWKNIEAECSLVDTNKTVLRKLTELDEDLVTYITIHSILRPNKFKILAVSYPGAQGDRVILIEPGTGRRQKRKYVDIISYLPSKKITTLQEDKGKFSLKDIQDCINEISKYKEENSYKDGLKNFQIRFEPESLDSTIKIGVGFWSSPRFKISKIKDLDLKQLDYFVYITSDMKEWKIWSTGSKNVFSNTSGDIKIPLIYEIVE